MPDEPHDAILDRSLFRAQISESFAPQLWLLDQMTNYGTNLVPRCFESSQQQIPDIVAIISFLKHGVTCLDAVSILAREGAVMACFPHIRSLFEIDLYLRWIFEADYEERGAAYFVWNIRRKRYWLRCYLEGTPEYGANKTHMTGPISEKVTVPYSQEQLREAIDHETSRLELPELKRINEMFEARVKSNGTDVPWHQPFGPPNIRDMAKRLGDEAMYKIFYGRYSQITHGMSLEQQMIFDGDQVVFDHIRTLSTIDEAFQMAASYAQQIYHSTLNKFRPGELDAFRRKFTKEWRKPYKMIPTVTRKGSSFEISTAQKLDNKL